ncbi:hypothetical protein J2T17_007822 [Paenibacillus mucilaginosus]
MKRVTFFLAVLMLLSACGSQFNRVSWLEEPDKRNDMVYSLVKKYELEGMTEEEIISLLGEPEEKLDDEYVYYLGRAGLGVDDSLLRLYINENGNIQSYKITND